METTTDKPLLRAFQVLKDYAEDVARASHQNIDDAIKRFNHFLSSNKALSTLLEETLPEIDFDEWLDSVNSTFDKGKAGSAKLTWPLDPAKRLATQAELINRIANEQIGVLNFSMRFTYVGGRFDSQIAEFANKIFLPFHRDLVRLATPAIEAEEAKVQDEQAELLPYNFIHKKRFAELETIKASNFDLKRLIQLCREIDFCYRNECLFAVAALTRALLDHVPPIFGCSTFAEVANNYSGSRSFQESMQHLQNSARKIGDAHLHTHIRRKESLPTPTQVNFANDLDVLLGEIVRLLT